MTPKSEEGRATRGMGYRAQPYNRTLHLHHLHKATWSIDLLSADPHVTRASTHGISGAADISDAE